MLGAIEAKELWRNMCLYKLLDDKALHYRSRIASIEAAVEGLMTSRFSERSDKVIAFMNREWSVYSFALAEIEEIKSVLETDRPEPKTM